MTPKLPCPSIREELNRTESIIFDDATRRFQGITDEQKSDWTEAFPKIDVSAELVKAAVWWMNNPAKRKKDIGRFLTNWLGRAERETTQGPPVPTETAVVCAPLERGPDGLTPRERVLAARERKAL